ncbi:T9SS type A sorting domain-containing protein [Chryseobacterium turcicum]|uniref:T9SS type A sorting domain-containing protein n=1 Tax=Chryseobacterium turcicum TaxID=2898076 RepID=A0A9Q3V4A4_9FLAO|nr:T9SS type A sorting domain-containing protein [Chryseobacterium turcicum]MCD1117035.1 T9SS type A sorting domain-containing protein [Chryseobacterium turcicum]
MKKILSSLLLVSGTILMFGQAQTLVNENFEALNLGDVTTDVTGATAGQGNMYLSGGTSANYQIATIDAANGKSLQVTTGNGAPTSTGNTNTRWVWKEITATATAANNITVTRGKIYTGAANGAGNIKLIIYGAIGTSSGTLGGIKYNYATKTIQGEAYITLNSTPQSAGVLTVTLGTQTFPANTWVDVEHRYNKTTGLHEFKYTGSIVYSYSSGQVTSGGLTYTGTTVAGLVPAESDIVNDTAAGNTVANTAGVDLWNVEFSNNVTLSVGETKEAVAGKLFISIYPNPTSDILNIKTDSKINSVSIVDITGKKVNVKLEGDKVDVRNLPAGMYLINVETKDGISTEKFIKK